MDGSVKDRKRRVLIFSGGNLGEWALEEVGRAWDAETHRDTGSAIVGANPSDDILVGADRGAWFLVSHGIRPDVSMGDFDSVGASELADIRANSDQFIQYDPVDKDWTDTELAMNWALEQRPDEIVLLGALGTRFDHSLSNVHLLRKALAAGVPCNILDEHNEIRLVSRRSEIRPRPLFPQISLLPLTETVTGITLHGFRYPLTDATITIGQSVGISNVLDAETGSIEVGQGLLLVVQSRD
jgi:thiamine pyrophosphokinase